MLHNVHDGHRTTSSVAKRPDPLHVLGRTEFRPLAAASTTSRPGTSRLGTTGCGLGRTLGEVNERPSAGLDDAVGEGLRVGHEGVGAGTKGWFVQFPNGGLVGHILASNLDGVLRCHVLIALAGKPQSNDTVILAEPEKVPIPTHDWPRTLRV